MSTPDYDQFSEDHQCLLIVIKQIGPQMNPNLFNLIYDRLSQLYEFKVSDNKGMGFERTIRLRFKQSYSIENNNWGDFQAHRRLVGLITIARSFNDNEIESICELHNTIRDTYADTLFDSRCFVIRSSSPTVEITSNNEWNEAIEQAECHSEINETEDTEMKRENVDISLQDENNLFDFHLGDPLFMAPTDHNSFSTHVNRSSSSSSSSTSPSSFVSNVNNKLSQTSQRNCIEDTCTANNSALINSNSNIAKGGYRSRTHSRNKSLDSNLYLNSGSSNNSAHSSQMMTNRLHSSSTSLFKSSSGDALHSGATTNEYIRYENDIQCCEQIELRVRDFITGLFWVLESKRLDRASEKMDKIPLLIAPFEKKDLIGLDTDTRSFRRKCMGRMRKHIADLSLLAGLPQESLCNYISAIDQLKACNDKLWLAAAYEGLCAASLALQYPNRWHQIHSLRRQFHFNKNLFQELISRCDYEVARSEVGDYMAKISSKHCVAEDYNNSNKAIAKNILNIDQYYERYKEAASHYAMYRGAAILEFECSFKAARTLIFFDRFLKASEFIQNAVFILFSQSTEDQIERLLQISQLYENIRFYRKSAFYKRFAALKSVSLQLKNPNWDKCYYLLLSALHSYGVTLDPNEYDNRQRDNNLSWSGIHSQLIQEMITTAIRMQNETLAIRHLSFILQCLFNHITLTQRQEFATKLSSLASRCGEGSPVILKLINGAIIPSVNFTKFPTVIYFKVEPLAPYLRPVKLKLNSSEEPKVHDQGPFIYTPLQLNRTPRKPVNSNLNSKVNFFWAEGHTGKITLRLHNFLPIEMNISSITVMTDGVAFEPNHETALKISATNSHPDISLNGIPRGSGILEILGYKIHTLGIKSDCLLSQLPNARRLKLPSKFAVEVVPRLPLMCAQCLSTDITEEIREQNVIPPKCESFSDIHISNSSFIKLYSGQRQTFQIKLSNISRNVDELINYIDLQAIFAKTTNQNLRKLINFEWNSEQLNNLLPIERDQNITFDITFVANGDFVFQTNPTKITENNLDKSKLSVGNKKSQVFGSTKLANLINEFQSKKMSTDSIPLTVNKSNDIDSEHQFPTDIFNSKMIEFCLRFDYSGGLGFESGFCRQTSIHFFVEIMPSVFLTHWDVLSAEKPDECYLVFDALNATQHELNLLYAENKEMLIEPREKCRIPVPIKRCPLNLSEMDQNCAENSLPEMDNQLGHRVSNKLTSLHESIDFLSYIFPTEHKLEAILNRSRIHIQNQINLQWTIPFTDDQGLVSVAEIPYSNEMLKSLLIPPIQSEVQVDDITYRSSLGEATTKIGEKVSVHTRLLNTAEASLHLLRLCLFCYQDYQNVTMSKQRNHNVNSKFVINGCDSLCIDQLSSKETHEHECSLIFLYAGIYKLEICCLPEESYQRSGNQQQWPDNTQSLFTCLHTIEITVEE